MNPDKALAGAVAEKGAGRKAGGGAQVGWILGTKDLRKMRRWGFLTPLP